jgi:acetyltransferase-like isoleucine patch superfamily enzyme
MVNIFKFFKVGIKWIKGKINIYKFKRKWRSNNSHNYTCAEGDFSDIAKVGNQTYGVINVKYFGNKDEHLTVGHYCSIADDVVFLTGGNHNMNTFSQFPFAAYYNLGKSHKALTKGPIVVQDDVWIGYGATILSGVTIGQGAIIGARSVVSKDVPPYAIFVGNKVVKYRYTDDIIDKMIKFDFSKLTPEEIEKNGDLMYKEIDDTFFETDFYKNHIKN